MSNMFKEKERLAQGGNVDAMGFLHWSYYKGENGVAQDFEKAKEWGLKSVANGDDTFIGTTATLRDAYGVEFSSKENEIISSWNPISHNEFWEREYAHFDRRR